MSKRRIEICCFSYADAMMAQRNGADQLELCVNRPEGGSTPSYGVLKTLAHQLSIPATVIIRPSAGHFYYTSSDWECMKEDIQYCKSQGYPAISIGLLSSDQQKLDYGKLEELQKISEGLKLIFHKAFDALPNPEKALLELKSLGFTAVMSSGGQQTAMQGIENLKKLKSKADKSGIEIIAAGGIRSNNLKQLMQSDCAHVYHSAISSYLPKAAEPYGNSATFTENEITAFVNIYRALEQ
jgi:copper homeostasis protein